MKKKTKYEKILDFVFWGIIIVLTGIELYNSGLSEFNISELKIQEIAVEQYILFVLTLFFVTLFCGIVSMFKEFWITIAYFGIKIALKKHAKERIEKVDLKNDNYYRDILPKYSPSVLSYIDDFKIGKEDIVATILSLELKGKIKIEDDDIVVINYANDGLDENETYILDKIRKRTLTSINMLEYQRVVKRDSLKSGMLQEKENVEKGIKRKIVVNVIVYILVLLSFSMLPYLFLNINDEITLILAFALLVVVFALVVFVPFVTISYISSYKLINKAEPYVRSDEGKVINEKLEGLRKYLIDFSKIEEKTTEQLVLWNEYLIYSVILGINSKVVEDVYRKIK